jgi:hypothetical protein
VVLKLANNIEIWPGGEKPYGDYIYGRLFKYRKWCANNINLTFFHTCLTLYTWLKKSKRRRRRKRRREQKPFFFQNEIGSGEQQVRRNGEETKSRRRIYRECN